MPIQECVGFGFTMINISCTVANEWVLVSDWQIDKASLVLIATNLVWYNGSGYYKFKIKLIIYYVRPNGQNPLK